MFGPIIKIKPKKFSYKIAKSTFLLPPLDRRFLPSTVVTHILLTATINYFPKALNPQHNPIDVLLPLPLLYNLMNPLSIQATLLRFSTQTDHNNGFQSMKANRPSPNVWLLL